MPDALPISAPAASSRSKLAVRRRPPARTAAPAPDRILPRRLGRYQLFAHIGHGGMADIYLAQADAGLGGSRLVVIKEVLPRLAHLRDFADMLVSEAKLAARLNHVNVVKVEDLGRADAALFIAMEYVEGLDLREMLRRCAKTRVALPVEFSLRVVIEILRGLSFAHRARDDDGRPLGIVHRDVSPSNILLSFEGEVKVCDFGIARANTASGQPAGEDVAGKAGYMSPEQARGEPLDARADVFAAGIILWEMLSGRRLYRAAEGERLLDVACAAVIPELPSRGLPREEELHAIVTRALRADRDERFASAAAMLQALEDYVAAARMFASPIRFGEWLMEQFGQEVVLDRRARERGMRALALGPAAVLEPIARALPDIDATPSTFPIALLDPSAPRVTEPRATASGLAPSAPPARGTPAAPERSRGLIAYAVVLAALAYFALRMLVV